MRDFRILIITLLFSLMVHTGLWLGISAIPQTPAYVNLKQPSIVDLIEIPKKPDLDISRSKMYVRQTEVPKEELTDIDLQARFFSEKLRRVLLETQAKLSGLSANRRQQAAKSASEPKNTSSGKLGENLSASPNGDILSQEREGSRYLSALDRSTLGERLPDDVQKAELTALNTDAYLYYSFYSRLEELIRPRWIQAKDEAIESNPTQARLYVSGGELTCTYEVVLDANGNFIRAIAMHLSGFDAYDFALVQAFQRVGRIPNPPKDLIRTDGTVRIPLQATVRLRPMIARE